MVRQVRAENVSGARGALINQRLQNNSFVGAPLLYDSREAEMAAFDALPPRIRLVLNEGVNKLASKTIAHHLAWARSAGRGEDATLRKLAEIEKFEMEVWAGRYLAETGQKLPHAEAGATVQRYGHLGPSRHPARRYGKPGIVHRRAKRRFHPVAGVLEANP